MEFGDVLEALKDQLGDRHIMLSYQWDKQELVAKVYEVVQAHDINIWMDIHGGVTGNINEAMATGVEGSATVCCFMSQKYEKSKNCSAELNYANDRGTTIVPCMAQNRTEQGNCYKASGWLGILTAGKLWIDFKSEDQLEMRVVQLLTECCSRLCKSETPVGKMQYLKSRITKKKPEPKKKKVRSAAAAKSADDGLMILPDECSITVPLNQPLEPGDQIEVWGEYEYGEKFNFNLIGDTLNEILLHFDIRPTQNTVVMNNKVNGVWQTEIRDPRVVRNFERGEYDEKFELIVKYEDDKLVFFINGDKMRKSFPIRVPMREGRNVVLRDEEGLGRWKKLRVPEARITQESKDTTAIKTGEEIILEEALKVGDSVEVWGTYQGGEKYTFNIMRNKDDFLLHFDIRPNSGTLCLDATTDGNWPGSINLHLDEDDFENLAYSNSNGDFHIKVEFQEEGMDLFINGKGIGETLPYTFDLNTATHITCVVPPGSEKNPWKKIKLPKPRQLLQSFGTYEFEKLCIGDVINFTGIYRANVDAFAINIMADTSSIQLHISIRATARTVVLNAITNGSWGQEIRASIPDPLAECGMFDIFVMVEEKAFNVEFSKDEENENVLLAMKMPHRSDFSKARYITFRDVTDDVWTELNMPDGTSYSREVV